MERDLDDLEYACAKNLDSSSRPMTRAAQYPRLYIWTLCASVSLWSSRRIVVDWNLHFPLHLHLWHLSVLAFLIALKCWQQPRTTSSYPTLLGWILLLALACSTALSMVFTLQAVLHFPNLTTLDMLSKTFSYLPELLIALHSAQISRSRLAYVRITLLAASCAGVLIFEYRLLVKGLLSSLLAVLFFGTSRILYALAERYHPSAISVSSRIDALSCGTGIIITVASMWAVYAEDNWRVREGLHTGHAPLLMVNALTTTTAMLLGRSSLFPAYATEQYKRSGYHNAPRTYDIFPIFVLTSITGTLSAVILRRSYMTSPQMCAFLVALICIDGGLVFESGGIGKHRDAQQYTPLSQVSELAEINTATAPPFAGMIEPNDTPVPATRAYRTVLAYSHVLLAAGATLLWFAFMVLNFSDQVFLAAEKPLPIFDTAYEPTVAHEIVISMYKERVEDVRSLIESMRSMPGLSNSRVHIYIKDDEANNANIKTLTKANEITTLPNVGREAETYLSHILRNWDSLARQTFFLQADIHSPREFFPHIRNYFDPKTTGMMSFGWSGNVCNCEECGDNWLLKDPTGFIPQLHDRINNSTKCKNVLLSYNGQFVVSAQRIRGVDKKIYEDLRDAFVNPDSWAHKEPYLQGRLDSMNSPEFGFMMERLWNLLFQCSDMDVAWRCPTLLSGYRFGGNREDCQCFDPVP